MKQIAKIILLNNHNEFLFQLRDNNPKIIEPGTWSWFGGSINKKEDILTGLKREINEELPDCLIKDIEFLDKGYIELKKLRIVNYWIGEINKPNPNKNSVQEIQVFKGKINENIYYINRKITEGQRAGYFRLDQLENLGLPNFTKKFLYKHMKSIFY